MGPKRTQNPPSVVGGSGFFLWAPALNTAGTEAANIQSPKRFPHPKWSQNDPKMVPENIAPYPKARGLVLRQGSLGRIG